MPNKHESTIETNRQGLEKSSERALFHGFEPLRSNNTYTPNQFFDVCLPHSPVGVVRLVGYMLRQTIGWCDKDGNPLHERLTFTYSELIEKAGISRGAIRLALEKATKGNFIRRTQTGRSKSSGDAGQSSIYEIKWDPRGEYIKHPASFQGFYNATEAHRTSVPNQFFDEVLPQESLSVVKVVGAVIRLTIGFTNNRGDRRLEIALSYTHIQRYTKIANPSHVSKALKFSIKNNYIVCTDHGFFDRNAGKKSRASAYGLKWLDLKSYNRIGTKRIAAVKTHDRYKKDSGIGSKRIAEDQYKKDSPIEMLLRNNIIKQQQPGVADKEFSETLKKLTEIGFSEKIARALLSLRAVEEVENQIAWLYLRNPKSNKLGMLRKAIQEGWPEPKAELGTSQVFTYGERFAKSAYAGYNRNPGESTAEPKPSEIQMADRFVHRLFEVWPDKNQVPNWGRQFGKFVYEQNLQISRKGNFLSIDHALRVYSDAFFMYTKNTREKFLKEVEVSAKIRYQAEHRSEWIDYLQESLEQMKKDSPGEYAAFEAWREEDRQNYIQSLQRLGLKSDRGIYQSPETKFLNFHDFFKDKVLDFWAWDKRYNTHKVTK